MLDKNDIEVIKELLQPINDKLDKHSAKLNELQAGQDKHSLLLENMNKKLNTVIEGQQAQAERIDHKFEKLEKNITDKIEVTQLAVKNTSKDVKDIKETTDQLNKENKKLGVVTGQNCLEIEYLKKLK